MPPPTACPLGGGAPGRLELIVCGQRLETVYVGLPGSITTDGKLVARTASEDLGSMENVLFEWLRVKRVSDDATVALFSLIDDEALDALSPASTLSESERVVGQRREKALQALEARTARANAWLANYSWRALSREPDLHEVIHVRLRAEVAGDRVRLAGLAPDGRREAKTLRTFDLAAWTPAFPRACFVPNPPVYAELGAADEESGIVLIDIHGLAQRCIPPRDDFHVVRVDREWLRPLEP